MTKQWIVQHGPMILLTTLVVIQWIAFQVLLVHYHHFRKSMKKPRPEGLRIGLLEKTVKIQTENMDAIFRKLAELSKDIAIASAQSTRPTRSENAAQSLEGSLMTMGEMNLKKRLQQMSHDDKAVVN